MISRSRSAQLVKANLRLVVPKKGSLSKNARVQPCAGVDNLEGLSFFILDNRSLELIKEGKMSEVVKAKKEPDKFKIYAVAILIYLLINGLVFEFFIGLLENQLKTFLFPMFPYTRIALLIMTVLIAKRYIDKRSEEPKKKRGLFFKISKYAVLAIIFIGLTYGAFFSVVFYDPTPNEPIVLPELPQPTRLQIDTQYIGQ